MALNVAFHLYYAFAPRLAAGGQALELQQRVLQADLSAGEADLDAGGEPPGPCYLQQSGLDG